MPNIQVRRELLIALATGLAAALLALAFVLGRESGRPRPAPAEARAAPDPAPAAPAAAGPLAPAPPLPFPALPLAGVPAPAAAAPAAPGQPAPARPADPVRAAVAGYLEAIDRIQPGQLAGDPEALARGIMEGLAKGDTNGLDNLIRQSETARASLAALNPPPPCADHHRESLAALDESLGIMAAIRTSLLGGTGGSLEITAQANQLRARAEKLQAEEQALRQRYGLAR